ncbi:MAG: TatD family hydrolase [Tannerellaceae bacterium]|nr:TatD family hydrolase [Tannerellaceae bacterium]
MYLIDTHSHLYLDEFAADQQQVLLNAKEKNIGKIILPNVDTETIEGLFKLSEQYIGYLYPLVGLHPTSVGRSYSKDLKIIESYLDKYKIYGIGEIGIDLYWDTTYKKEQIEVFEEQLKWSKDLGLPVSIHTRNAFPEVIESIYKVGADNLKGVLHSFSGTQEELAETLKLKNFALGINGVITFKNSNLTNVLQNTTLDKLVLETDAPYLSPVPYRGKRNEPAYLWNTAQKLAETFNVDVCKVAEITTENALKLFPIS